MSIAHSVVVLVMSWCYLHATSTKLPVYHGVSYYLDLSLGNERMDQLATYVIFETGILGMHCYTCITEHCFESSGGDVYKFIGIVFERVSEGSHHTKLYFLFVSRYSDKGSFLYIDVFYFNI